MDDRTQQELVPFVAAIMGIVFWGVLGLFFYFLIRDRQVAIIAMFASDAIAGALALWVAYISTRQNPIVRIIVMGAIFFFAFGRIAQFLLI
jgi:hypothetical protein